MELPELGKQCTHVSCLQLDFLPVKCDLCSKVFCKDHSSSNKHDCKNNDNNFLFKKKEISSSKSLQCTYEGCTETSLVEMLCVRCQQHFCIKHRLHYFCYDNKNMQKFERTREIKAQYLKAKTASDKQVDTKLKELINNPKSSATALKVRLMKLKLKAIGDARISTEDRVYFTVHPSLLCSGLARAVFVSKDWTIGKCIDVFSKKMKIENNNDKPDSTKLRLFNKEDGKMLANSTSFGDLINQKAITDGGSLVLEYLTEKTVQLVDDIPVLAEPDHYI